MTEAHDREVEVVAEVTIGEVEVRAEREENVVEEEDSETLIEEKVDVGL